MQRLRALTMMRRLNVRRTAAPGMETAATPQRARPMTRITARQIVAPLTSMPRSACLRLVQPMPRRRLVRPTAALLTTTIVILRHAQTTRAKRPAQLSAAAGMTGSAILLPAPLTPTCTHALLIAVVSTKVSATLLHALRTRAMLTARPTVATSRTASATRPPARPMTMSTSVPWTDASGAMPPVLLRLPVALLALRARAASSRRSSNALRIIAHGTGAPAARWPLPLLPHLARMVQPLLLAVLQPCPQVVQAHHCHRLDLVYGMSSRAGGAARAAGT